MRCTYCPGHFPSGVSCNAHDGWGTSQRSGLYPSLRLYDVQRSGSIEHNGPLLESVILPKSGGTCPIELILEVPAVQFI
jgi:hypothetical protein